jgi:hypothetical protein
LNISDSSSIEGGLKKKVPLIFKEKIKEGYRLAPCAGEDVIKIIG